jgi:hypothetical protein
LVNKKPIHSRAATHPSSAGPAACALELDSEDSAAEISVRNQSTLELLAELAGEVAHEINNPLFVMSGRLRQLVKLSQRGLLPEERLISTMESIATHVDRVKQVTQSLLELSRSLGVSSECDLGSVFNSAELKIQPFLQATEADFSFGGDLKVIIRSGPAALVMVLEHVIRSVLSSHFASSASEAKTTAKHPATTTVYMDAARVDDTLCLSLQFTSTQPLMEFSLYKNQVGEPEPFELNIARLTLKAWGTEVIFQKKDNTARADLIFPPAFFS